ncbi:MAG: thymidylate kinase [Candidatus Pacebacteria bacterium]|nr:thymidylate kinase [Candidatus Paceibacterota bacterium]
MSKLLVIEGADGAGKATQTKLLVERLRSEGYVVESIDFPRYESNHFGKLIRECLDGKRGDFMKLDPRITSTLYAADRFESSKQIKQWLNEGKIVVADRYVSANMLHQGAKLTDEDEREEFLVWLDKIEHGVFELPRPDSILYLEIPYETRKDMMGSDRDREGLDVSETDADHQAMTEQSARTLVASLNVWRPILCVADGSLRTREDIHQDVYLAVVDVIKN